LKPEEAEKENQPQDEVPLKQSQGKGKGSDAQRQPKNKKQALMDSAPSKSKPTSIARQVQPKPHILSFSPHPNKTQNRTNPSNEETEDEEDAGVQMSPPSKKVRVSAIVKIRHRYSKKSLHLVCNPQPFLIVTTQTCINGIQHTTTGRLEKGTNIHQ
jgi:hypothetical protein